MHLELQLGPTAAELSMTLNSTENWKIIGDLENKLEQYVQCHVYYLKTPWVFWGSEWYKVQKFIFFF